jgi:hypothetical protein
MKYPQLQGRTGDIVTSFVPGRWYAAVYDSTYFTRGMSYLCIFDGDGSPTLVDDEFEMNDQPTLTKTELKFVLCN